jgi:type II secretory ATPase GspE/PulE/Tfp pilus assembly ATPase PilB-like protein
MTETRAFQPAELMNMDAESAVHEVLRHASSLHASDVFLFSEEKAVQVAMRRLGRMDRMAMVPSELGRHMTMYIKTRSEMDLAEHRRPQEGRWLADIGERRLDLRVDCVPTLYGQDLSMRIWDRDDGVLALDQLGLAPAEHGKLTSMLDRPSGLVLMAGPSGTGITTTLYACLQHLNGGHRKINSLEDPIEFSLPGVRQSQINPRFDVDYATLLRHVLRQAPDVIMVGEIRDSKTAAIALQAANGGQLVIAALPAAAAAIAVHNLLALNVHPYFLSSCLLGVVAQRLIRVLCHNCRVYYDLGESPQTFEEIADLLPDDHTKAFYGPGGCEPCYQTGYSSRTGVFEVLLMNQELRRMVAESRSRSELEAAAVRAGMVTFRRAALLKVAEGITSTEDVLREMSAELLGIED